MTIESDTGTSRTLGEDPTDQLHQFTYDTSEDCSVAVSIVRAVAAVAGTDPLSVRPRLYDVLDPDALEKLVGADGTGDGFVSVTFELADFRITVGRGRQILIEELDRRSSVPGPQSARAR